MEQLGYFLDPQAMAQRGPAPPMAAPTPRPAPNPMLAQQAPGQQGPSPQQIQIAADGLLKRGLISAEQYQQLLARFGVQAPAAAAGPR